MGSESGQPDTALSGEAALPERLRERAVDFSVFSRPCDCCSADAERGSRSDLFCRPSEEPVRLARIASLSFPGGRNSSLDASDRTRRPT